MAHPVYIHYITFQSGVNMSIVSVVGAVTSVLMTEQDEEDREQGRRQIQFTLH
jgi:hypothetical protein